MIALADCNNFYCSCERVFQPELAQRPLVVLSNNDGCVISRSEEVKAMGIAMGDPYFKIKELIGKHDIAVRSSNYTLYGDMSQRVHATMELFTPEVEAYSIDEAFLSLEGITGDLEAYARHIRQTVLRHTGIPVSIGVAATKTLAKVGSKLAKRLKNKQGACLLASPAEVEAALRDFPVGDVWGIGPSHVARLARLQVQTALAFSRLDPQWVLKEMAITGLRTWQELHGEPSIDLELEAPPSKQIVRSRSFGRPMTQQEELAQSIAMHASRAAEKLRQQQLAAGVIGVFIRTNPFIPNEPQYSQSLAVRLPMATADTTLLLRLAGETLQRIYRPGYRYKKSGVMLMELCPADAIQGNLFWETDTAHERKLNGVLDEVNRRFGRFALRHAAVGWQQGWKMQQNYRSPAYTTRWDQLPVVHAAD